MNANRGIAYEMKMEFVSANTDYRKQIDLSGEHVNKVRGWIRDNEEKLRQQKS